MKKTAVVAFDNLPHVNELANEQVVKSSKLYDSIRSEEIERTIDGRTVMVKRATVALSAVKLWHDNPRLTIELAKAKASNPNLKTFSQAQLRDVLKPVSINLKEGLRETGPAQDPILVFADGTIFEGNRRKYCYESLLEEGDNRFAEILIEIYSSELTKGQLANLVGVPHLAGAEPWPSLGKAVWIRGMRAIGRTDEQIATIMQCKKREVVNYIDAADLMTEYQTTTRDFRPDQFTKFLVLCGSVKARKMFKEDPAAKQWMFQMMKKNKIIKSHHAGAKLYTAYLNKGIRSVLELHGSGKANEAMTLEKDGKIAITAKRLGCMIDKISDKQLLVLHSPKTKQDRNDKEWLSVLKLKLESLWEKIAEVAA